MMAWEWRVAALAADGTAPPPLDQEPATIQERDRFHERLEAELDEGGFFISPEMAPGGQTQPAGIVCARRAVQPGNQHSSRGGPGADEAARQKEIRLTETPALPSFRPFPGTWIAPAGCDAGSVATP